MECACFFVSSFENRKEINYIRVLPDEELLFKGFVIRTMFLSKYFFAAIAVKSYCKIDRALISDATREIL